MKFPVSFVTLGLVVISVGMFVMGAKEPLPDNRAAMGNAAFLCQALAIHGCGCVWALYRNQPTHNLAYLQNIVMWAAPPIMTGFLAMFLGPRVFEPTGASWLQLTAFAAGYVLHHLCSLVRTFWKERKGWWSLAFVVYALLSIGLKVFAASTIGAGTYEIAICSKVLPECLSCTANCQSCTGSCTNCSTITLPNCFDCVATCVSCSATSLKPSTCEPDALVMFSHWTWLVGLGIDNVALVLLEMWFPELRPLLHVQV